MRRLGVGIIGVVAVGLSGGGAIAQNAIVPDGTTDSIIEPFNSDIDVISGGFINESNLLHSFREFNIGEGRGAYFYTEPSNIENIFSRITGNNPSEILGVLGTFGNSVPDVWLINPNGILFGPNSQLDLGGSFLATTADEVQIEGIGTIAVSAITDNSDVLRIDSSAFIFNRDNPNARIINQSQSPLSSSPSIPLSGFDDYAGLEVSPGQTIGLISRDISLQGGGLNTLHGNIFLRAVEDIELNNGATIQAGNILIDTNRLSVEDGSQLLTQFTDPRISEYISYFSEGGSTAFSIDPDDSLQRVVPVEIGDVFISARESVNISGASADGQHSSRIGTGAVGALRTGGNITLETDRLTISGGGQITSDYLSVSDGNEGGGTTDIDSSLVEITGSYIVPENANSDVTERFSGIRVGSSIIDPGDGSVQIRSEEFNLLEGARVFVDLSERKFSENTPFFPGEINIESNSVLISGVSERSARSVLSAGGFFFDGKTTPITITSNSLTVRDGAGILGQDININLSETLLLEDDSIVSSPNVSLSGGTVTLREQAIVSANQQGYGSSGDISINVDQLNILDSAQLSASIDRPGSGGSIDINARDAVNIVGDIDSARPSSIRAATDGPGTGGQVAIRTRQLNIQNGSRIVASLNGGGTGGSVVIEAEESVNISGESKRGRPSGIFADSNLENGEFVVLRSLREDSQSPQFISMLLDTEVILFTQAPSLIRSIPRTGNTGSNQIFLNYNPADDDPRSAESLFPKGDDVESNRFIAIDSVGLVEQSRPTTEAPSGSFDNTEIPTNQSILTGSTVFNTQEVGTARQVLFSHFNVPDRGVLITGQSISTNFAESIQGGERIFLTDDETASLRSNFVESLESIKNVELVELEDIETNPDEFAGVRREGIFNDLDAISSAFSNNAGELYIIESTGEEFRIKDDRYTDTRFTDIQAGDRFLVFAVRDGGDISIETDSLTVRDGAAISTTSRGASTGNAAASQLDITANSVLIENNATISAISETGSGGNISVRTSDMRLNNSMLTASAEKNANGGNITINAGNGTLRTDNGSILSSSDSVGGGNVTIDARTIRFDGDSDVQADVSGGSGDGGNINLTADYIVAFDDSDIFANAEGGSGGIINLNTPGFFGRWLYSSFSQCQFRYFARQ